METSPPQPTEKRRCETIQAYFTGAPHVGLRMLVHRVCFQQYDENLPYDPTGEEERKMVMAQRGPVILNCDIIRYNGDPAWTKTLAARSDALICVYSVADRFSFDYVRTLCRDLAGPVLFVAASKTDLPDWKVSLEEGKEFSSDIGAEFLIMSAKTGVGCGDDDVIALVDHVYLSKAKAEEEMEAKAANQAVEETTESVAGKSKVHHMVSRVIQRLKRSRDKGDAQSGGSAASESAPPAG